MSSARRNGHGPRCSGCGINPAATKRSAELFAAEVMPHFQGQAQPTLDAAARASEAREGLAQSQNQAVEHMTKKYESEKRHTKPV